MKFNTSAVGIFDTTVTINIHVNTLQINNNAHDLTDSIATFIDIDDFIDRLLISIYTK